MVITSKQTKGKKKKVREKERGRIAAYTHEQAQMCTLYLTTFSGRLHVLRLSSWQYRVYPQYHCEDPLLVRDTFVVFL